MIFYLHPVYLRLLYTLNICYHAFLLGVWYFRGIRRANCDHFHCSYYDAVCLSVNMLGALCSTSRLLMISKIRLNWLRERLGPNEDCIKMAILAPGAIFEVLPRAKISKLGQSKHYTSSTTQNDARNIEKSDWIDFGERLGRNEDCTKLASFYRFLKKDGTSKLQMLFKLLSFDKAWSLHKFWA